MMSLGWSYEGAEVLVEYLLEYEEDIGSEMELDPVCFNAEFSEYDSAMDFMEDTGLNQSYMLEALVGQFKGGIVFRCI